MDPNRDITGFRLLWLFVLLATCVTGLAVGIGWVIGFWFGAPLWVGWIITGCLLSGAWLHAYHNHGL